MTSPVPDIPTSESSTKTKRKKRTLWIVSCVVIFLMIIGILLFIAVTESGDKSALNPNAYSYFNQTWEGQTINLPLDIASTLIFTDENGKGRIVMYPNSSDVVIKNRENTHDPTMAELKAFLKADRTNNLVYVNQSFVCTNYAVALHDNSEGNGIHCGFVCVSFNDADIPHALNAFQTTDEGLVFVDDTGTRKGNGIDSFAKIKIGYPVSEVPVFKSDSSILDYLPWREPVNFGIIFW
jgi:hypothetical protein